MIDMPNTLKRKLILTHDLVHLTRNGGIGTAFTALAEYWAKEEESEVTILWLYGEQTEGLKSFKECQKYYESKNITLIPAPKPERVVGPQMMVIAYNTYAWVKEHQSNFDVIIGHEWNGPLSLIAQARELGDIHIPVVVNVHSPFYWHIQSDQVLSDDMYLLVDAMERNSIRYADLVITPSHYMMDWLLTHDYHMHSGAVIPNQWLDLDWPDAVRHEHTEIDEIIFFGRQDGRKGITFFCDVIERLMKERNDFMVTFLGKEGYVHGTDSGPWIEEKVESWGIPLNIITDLDQEEAIAYIQEPHRLTVICSEYENAPYVALEAALSDIPFLIREGGGVAEMIHEDYTYTTKDELFTRIVDVIDNGMKMVNEPLLLHKHKIDAMWNDLPLTIPDRKPPVAQTPFVSVVVPHYNRPKLLKRCLTALKRQTYNNYEIIVVDDASDEKHQDQIKEICNIDRVRLVKKDKNEYLGAARNTGLKHARGEYIIFCDNDNVAYQHMIEKFVACILTSDVDIVTTTLDVFTGRSPLVTDHIFPFVGTEPHAGFYSNQLGDATMIVKRENMPKSDWYTTARTGHEDWEFQIRSVLSGLKQIALPEPLIHYFSSPEGMLLSGNPAADIRRNLSAWKDMDNNTYYAKMIHEVGFSSNINKKEIFKAYRGLQSQLQQIDAKLDEPMPPPPTKGQKKPTSRGRRGKK